MKLNGRNGQRMKFLQTFIVIMLLLIMFALLFNDDSHLEAEMSVGEESQEFHFDFPSFLKPKSEYVVPSIDDVINTVIDNDFERVLLEYKEISDIPQSPAKGAYKKVILISYWRAGSEYLGEILNSIPGTFYHYESFMNFELRELNRVFPRPKITNHITELLKCNYTGKHYYVSYAKEHPDLYGRNKRMASICEGLKEKDKCYLPPYAAKMCSIFPIQLFKSVQARLSNLEPLMEDNNVQVIWLVRDPRGTSHSRLKANWCNVEYCKNPKHLCVEMESDFMYYKDYEEKYPNKIMMVKYEELDKNPYNTVNKIFDFLNILPPPETKSTLKRHLSANVELPWTTYRTPGKQFAKWVQAPWTKITQTQKYCKSIIEKLGYKYFETVKDKTANFF